MQITVEHRICCNLSEVMKQNSVIKTIKHLQICNKHGGWSVYFSSQYCEEY